MKKALIESVWEMDNKLGEVVCGVESLSNVEVELGQFVCEMNQAEKTGELQNFLLDNYRSIRIYSDLLSYVARDLNRDYKYVANIHQDMFDKITGKEKDAQIATVTSSHNTNTNTIA